MPQAVVLILCISVNPQTLHSMHNVYRIMASVFSEFLLLQVLRKKTNKIPEQRNILNSFFPSHRAALGFVKHSHESCILQQENMSVPSGL